MPSVSVGCNFSEAFAQDRAVHRRPEQIELSPSTSCEWNIWCVCRVLVGSGGSRGESTGWEFSMVSKCNGLCDGENRQPPPRPVVLTRVAALVPCDGGRGVSSGARRERPDQP